MAVNSSILLNPGPVAVAPETWKAIARPAIHQRSAAFEAFFAQLQVGLQYLFQTHQPVLALAGSGTLGMEVTLRSLFAAGDKVVVQDNGKFSER
ncbi:MAG TPA: hypothetical protein ENJ82_15355, partial [Bacteroidetes bacterium]|nr:hypothetical protein [Bacteroidota bacterium]